MKRHYIATDAKDIIILNSLKKPLDFMYIEEDVVLLRVMEDYGYLTTSKILEDEKKYLTKENSTLMSKEEFKRLSFEILLGISNIK